MSNFADEVKERTSENMTNVRLVDTAREFLIESAKVRYSYNFHWLGRPIIQYPQDIVAMQELIWTIKPDLIVETGVAHGGSLIFYASILELNAICGGPAEANVIGIDIDIREHNKTAIIEHPMARRIMLVEGSSTDPDVVDIVQNQVGLRQRVMVCLDSNHTHQHVLEELSIYAPMTSVGSYCVVFDTLIEQMPDGTYSDRPWGRGNNPMSAIDEFRLKNFDFEVDRSIDGRLLISVAPGGFLKRIS